MADLGQYLQQFYSALGGMQQPPTQPGIGGQQQAPMPAASPGLFDMLSTPGAQGLLGAYLGYLSRPRGLNTNRWQGIGLGGLSGLNAMEQARSQQLQAPLRQAELQKATLETQNLQQTMQQRQEMLKQFDNDPAMQQLAKTNPMAHMLARNGIITGKMDAAALGIQKPMSQYEAGELKLHTTTAEEEKRHRQIEEQHAAAELAEQTRYHQGELGMRGAEVAATQARTGAEMALEPLRAAQIRASTAAAQARAATLKAAQVGLTPQQEKAFDQQAAENATKKLGPAPKIVAPGITENLPLIGGSAASSQEANQKYQAQWNAARDEEKATLINQWQARKGTAASAAMAVPAEESDLGTFHPYGEP